MPTTFPVESDVKRFERRRFWRFAAERYPEVFASAIAEGKSAVQRNRGDG
jgi:hypothetical protein